MKNTIGIVGGMGPLATCDLFRKIIEVTEAGSDQEHVRVVIDSNTEIPDRTAAILAGGKDPVPELRKSASHLVSIGADLLIMPCNTAHYFYDQVAPTVGVPFLHMIRETAACLKRQGVGTVGLLATDGTVQSGVYHAAFEEAGITFDDYTASMKLCEYNDEDALVEYLEAHPEIKGAEYMGEIKTAEELKKMSDDYMEELFGGM